jgi:ribonucleoside-diphosphate reductase alpha chain
VRPEDDIRTLTQKVFVATLIGTLQSCRIKFNHEILSHDWRRNCIEERLLGVSMTGQLCNHLTRPDLMGNALAQLRETAYYTNRIFANLLFIRPANRITCIKPEGTASLLANTASGGHPAHAEYYIRRVRIDSNDALVKQMYASGYPIEPDVITKGLSVASFLCKAPRDALLRKDVSAIKQLDMWMTTYDKWCDHKPSISVTVREDERDIVKAWIKKNFAKMSGVSFFPYSDASYAQLPFEEISETEYNRLSSQIRRVDWDAAVVTANPQRGGDACTSKGCDE